MQIARATDVPTFGTSFASVTLPVGIRERSAELYAAAGARLDAAATALATEHGIQAKTQLGTPEKSGLFRKTWSGDFQATFSGSMDAVAAVATLWQSTADKALQG